MFSQDCLYFVSFNVLIVFFYLYTVYACILYCISCCFFIVFVYCFIIVLALWIHLTIKIYLLHLALKPAR